jgi:hypothetical protein
LIQILTGGQKTVPIDDSLEERARKYEKFVREREAIKKRMYGASTSVADNNNKSTPSIDKAEKIRKCYDLIRLMNR